MGEILQAFPCARICISHHRSGFSFVQRLSYSLTEQIECAINEWESGISRMIVFKEHEYSTVYARHLSSLNEFKALTESTGQLTKLLEQVYRNGWYVNYLHYRIADESAVASARAGVVNSAIETGVPTKAVPTRAFLNAINDYERMEGTTGQHIAAEPEGRPPVEQPNDEGVVNGEESDLDPVDDWEDTSVDDELNASDD
jgi:Domain of unknown function (DUF6532)